METLNHLMLAHSFNTLNRKKVVSVENAVKLIRDGDNVATSGFVGTGFAEEIALGLERRYLSTRSPSNLTLIYAAGQGDGKSKGLNHLGHKGLIKRVIGGHWGLVPALQKLALENEIEAYNLPQGVISHLFRDIAAGKPGTISQVGIGTFVDPRIEGGKINDISEEDLVEVIELSGKEYLFYKAFPVNVAIIRGTSADTNGNLSMEKEALTLESLPLAMAAKNSGGIVIAQVERVCENKTLNPRQIHIPGIFIDCVVQADPDNHWQTFASKYNPSFSGEVRFPMSDIPEMPMDSRKVIARRAAFELKPSNVVNLGIGIPEGIANIANEEQILNHITLTAEPGIIGGLPAGGLDFGAAYNAEAIIDQPYQFDFYDGGGLDITFLGMAQADKYGNVNVSRFSNRLAGAGGFINISQNTGKVVFVGTFTSGKTDIEISNSELHINEDLGDIKFVDEVEQITFSGKHASLNGQDVLYVTERCVFRLTPDGLKLIEIAPGLDLEQDILNRMSFRPQIADPLKTMDSRIFNEFPMGLDVDLLKVPMEKRVYFQAETNELFINFENYSIRSKKDIEEIYKAVNDICKEMVQPANCIVNYDNFILISEFIDEFLDMIRYFRSQYFSQINGYTTSTFLRTQINNTLGKSRDALNIYDSLKEAEKALEQ